MINITKTRRYTFKTSLFILIFGVFFLTIGTFAVFLTNEPIVLDEQTVMDPLLFAAAMLINGVFCFYLFLTNDPID